MAWCVDSGKSRDADCSGLLTAVHGGWWLTGWCTGVLVAVWRMEMAGTAVAAALLQAAGTVVWIRERGEIIWGLGVRASRLGKKKVRG